MKKVRDYSRMQNVRLSLQQIGTAMDTELKACKEILNIKTSD